MSSPCLSEACGVKEGDQTRPKEIAQALLGTLQNVTMCVTNIRIVTFSDNCVHSSRSTGVFIEYLLYARHWEALVLVIYSNCSFCTFCTFCSFLV